MMIIMRFSRTVLVLSFVLLFCFSLTTFFLFSPPPAQNICITTSSSPSVSTISTTSSSPLQLSPSKPLIDYSWGTILSAFLPTYFSSAFTFPSYSPSPFSFASPSSTAPSSTSFLQTLRICFIVLRDLDRSLRDVVGLLLSSGASVTLVTLQGGGAGVGGQQGLVHIAIPTKQEFYVGPSILSSLAYRVKNFLHDKQHDFDVVHFKESEALGMFCLSAKSLGIDFAHITFVVHLQGSLFWSSLMARNWPTKVWQIETEVFSKSMVNMADVILSPTQHLMDYVGHHPGFNITGKYFIIPPILSSSSASSFLSFATPLSFSPAPDTVQEETRNVTAQNEIVFYGIINLKILAPAIENFCLHFDPSSLPFRVTLISALDMKTEELVEVAEGDGGGTPRYPYPPSRPISLLKRYWATTPCKNSELHLLDLDESSTMHYLTRRDSVLQSGRKLVIFSEPIGDRLPFLLHEAVANGVEIVTSDLGGIGEIFDSSLIDSILVRPNLRDLSEKLLKIWDNGTQNKVRLSEATLNAPNNWLNFFSYLSSNIIRETMEKEKQLRKEKENLNHEPLVTVCISHHERIELLAELLKGLFRNEYSNLEIIIIDDASSPNTQRQLDKVIAPLLTYPPPLFDSSSHHLRGGWKIIKQQASLYLGATRNRCFSHSKGDYVLFLDDDDVPKPDHIRKAVDVAHHTNAGLISTFFELFPGGTGFPGDETTSAPISTRSIYTFAGQSMSLSFFGNRFGGANVFTSRDAFLEVGGFTEYVDVGCEDYEFLVRAALKGVSQVVIPEPLLWVRRSTTGMLSTMDDFLCKLRALSPILSDERYREVADGLLVLNGRERNPGPPPLASPSTVISQ